MGELVPFPEKKKKSPEELAEAAQKAVDEGRISPMHPALSLIQRKNIVQLPKKSE